LKTKYNGVNINTANKIMEQNEKILAINTTILKSFSHPMIIIKEK